jgi:hypothetical protein
MSLTKKERDALPAEHFAVPGKRKLPIHDEKHVRMAWDMVDHTSGLTSDERRIARQRILSRARALGVDTSEWNKVKAMRFSLDTLDAMALAMPDTPDHPNKVPFHGILTRIDEPSDAAPNGSYGKRVLVTRAAAEKALPTLLGMAVDYTPNLDGHDARAKIGVITAATIEGDAIVIDGFFYAADFPNEVERIRADKEDLGFSFEAQRIRVASMEADPLVITEIVFTGAAVLQKDKAAYTSTAIAASADAEEMDEMEIKEILEAIGKLGERLEKIESGQASMQANKNVVEKVKPHADRLNDLADGMEAAAIGNHPTKGHVAHLRHMAASMMSDAHQGKMPHVYYASPGFFDASRDNRADTRPAADEETKKELGEVKASLANLTTVLKDVQAAQAKLANAPDRKTINPRITSLLAKAGVTLDSDKKLTVAELDKALSGGSLPPQARIELKIGLERAGLLTAA